MPSNTTEQSPSAPVCAKYQGNPVLVAGANGTWDQQAIGRESVLFNGTTYNMWYTSLSSLQIGYASSKDGLNWKKYPSPVLTAGPKGFWDQGGVESPSVIWNGTVYLMYYGGSNGTFASDIGVAFSHDMIHWQKYSANPVLVRTPNSFDAYSIKYPGALYDNSTYRIWYTARSQAGVNDSLGYATSTDGLHWIKYSDNPVISTKMAAWHIYVAARYTSVKRIGSAYLMVFLFTDLSDDMSFATSLDATHWNVSSTILLTNTGSTADWDFVPYQPSLVVHGDTLYLFYSGGDRVPSSTYDAIGLAYCDLAILLNKTSTVTTSSASSTASGTAQTTTTSAASTSSTSSAMPSTNQGGGIPEFPFELIAVTFVIVILAASYLIAKRNHRL
jgi:predicted GH43/DUF377 family glycosyl hydrolase